MNRVAALVITLAAVLGVGAASVAGAAEIREHRLESACIAEGRVPLWQAASAEDGRPDGFLPFKCVQNSP